MATFRKNRSGEWVVYGTVTEVTVGKVRVERKDGGVRWVNVGSVGTPFMAGGTMMVYGHISNAKPEPKVAKVNPVHLDQEAMMEAAMAEAQGRQEENMAEDRALDMAESLLF